MMTLLLSGGTNDSTPSNIKSRQFFYKVLGRQAVGKHQLLTIDSSFQETLHHNTGLIMR
jgi:hypothetical protein